MEAAAAAVVAAAAACQMAPLTMATAGTTPADGLIPAPRRTFPPLTSQPQCCPEAVHTCLHELKHIPLVVPHQFWRPPYPPTSFLYPCPGSRQPAAAAVAHQRPASSPYWARFSFCIPALHVAPRHRLLAQFNSSAVDGLATHALVGCPCPTPLPAPLCMAPSAPCDTASFCLVFDPFASLVCREPRPQLWMPPLLPCFTRCRWLNLSPDSTRDSPIPHSTRTIIQT